MNPLTRCRVLGCQNFSVAETHGAAEDEHGRPVYVARCSTHELAYLSSEAAHLSFLEVQLRWLVGEA